MNFKSTLDRGLRGSVVVVCNSLSQLEEQSKDTSVVAGGRRASVHLCVVASARDWFRGSFSRAVFDGNPDTNTDPPSMSNFSRLRHEHLGTIRS